MYSMCGVCICMLCNVCTCVSVCVMCIHVCMVYIMYACLHACAFHKHMKTTHTRQQARRLPRSRPRNKLVKFPAAVLQRAQRPACRGLATDLVAPPRRTANLLFWREMKWGGERWLLLKRDWCREASYVYGHDHGHTVVKTVTVIVGVPSLVVAKINTP
jgi:hypothetical protein